MPADQVFEKLTDEVSVPAAADLDAFQYHLMKYDGAGDAAVCDTLGEASLGVLQNDPVQGDSAVIGTGGYTRCIAGAALTRGGAATTNAAGRAVGAVATNYVRLQVITPAAADGDIFTGRLVDYIA